MKKDPVGRALGTLNRIAGWEWLDRAGLRKPLERAVYSGSRRGFAAISSANRRFKPVLDLARPARLPSAAHNAGKFDLTLTEDQQMYREAVSRLSDDVIAPAATEADEACHVSDDLLQQIHELGIGTLAVPEQVGGAGAERSPVTHTLVAEALARADMGIAMAALAPLGVINALVEWGDAEQQARYLPALIDDQFTPAALAVTEPTALFDPFSLQTRATETNEGFELNGTKSLVPLGERAELLLVAADLEGRGPRLFCVEKDTPGVEIEPEPAMGLRAAATARITCKRVALPADALLGGDSVAFDHERFIALGRVACAALTVGTAQSVLDYVIPYVKERKAFGEPIAYRQSVAFIVADIGLELEGLRLMTWRAAARAEQGKSFAREAYLAQLQAVEKGMEIGTNGVQLLGGHGFVKEHPVERWYRNLRGASAQQAGLIV